MTLSSHAKGQDPDEQLQVVDAMDRPVCAASRLKVHTERQLHRAVHVLVFNDTGDLYLQRRSQHKDSWPGYWDSSAGGHVRAGESYENAAKRKLLEELSLSAPLEFVGKIAACDATEQEFVSVYLIFWNGPIRPNDVEIDEARFFSIDQIRLELSNGARPFTSSFREVFRLYASSSPTCNFEE